MTIQKADADERTLFISPAGNDDSLGEEIPRNFKTVEKLEQVLDALDPAPDQNNQAGALCLTRGRFQPDTAYSPPDWTQTFMPVATIAGDSPTRDLSNAVVKANSFALFESTGISAYPNQWALDIDNVLAFGATQKAIFSFGGLGAVRVTNLSADIFLDAGQIGTTTEGVYIDSQGGGAIIANYDLIDLNVNGARAFYVDSGNGSETVSLQGNVIRLAQGATTGTALEVDDGNNISFAYQRVQGDVIINNGEVQLVGQVAENDVTINNGIVDVAYQKIGGDLIVNGSDPDLRVGRLSGDLLIDGATPTVNANRITGAITVTNSTAQIKTHISSSDITSTNSNGRYESQDHTGNVNHVSGGAVYRLDAITGNTTISAGTASLNSEAIFGTIDVDGGLLYADIKAISSDVNVANGAGLIGDIYSLGGDLTLAAGSTFNGLVNVLTGSLTVDPAATLDGRINGVEYGSWANSASEFTVTATRDGTIPTTWESNLRITLDFDNDTIDDVRGKFTKTTGLSRQVDFRIINVDTSLVYRTGTITTTATGEISTDISTVVNAFPVTGVVNLAIQAQRSGGTGINGAGGEIDITRT